MIKKEKEFFEKYGSHIINFIEHQKSEERREETEKKIDFIMCILAFVFYIIYIVLDRFFGFTIKLNEDIIFVDILQRVLIQLIVYFFVYSFTIFVLSKLKYRKIAYIITNAISFFSSYLFFEFFSIDFRDYEIKWYDILMTLLFISVLFWCNIKTYIDAKKKGIELGKIDYQMIMEYNKIKEDKIKKGKEVIRLNFKKKKIKKK